MPSKTYLPGQPVTIYYEVYGLTRNEVGQTRYQMDYRNFAPQGQALGRDDLACSRKAVGH